MWAKEGKPAPKPYEDIHMPKDTPMGFIIAIFAGILGFAMIWHMVIPAIIGGVGFILFSRARREQATPGLPLARELS